MFLRENEIGGKIAPWVEPGTTLLDVGSGTGRIARWLERRRGVLPTLADVTTFANRVGGLPFVEMKDPRAIPLPPRSHETVMMLFVLHHIPRWSDQELLIREAARVASRRVIVIEDTPLGRIDRAFNVFWDWLLNLRHGVPKPFTFRDVAGWEPVFAAAGLGSVHTETYRARWPTLGTYHHTLFVLDV